MATSAAKEEKWHDPEYQQQCPRHCYVGKGTHYQQRQQCSENHCGRQRRNINIKPTVNLLYMNANSIVNKMKELRGQVSYLKPDLIAIVETWKHPHIYQNTDDGYFMVD